MTEEFQDKVINCLECNQEFTWTAGEQRFYAEKGLKNTPKSCPSCRSSREREDSIEVTCEKCGSKGHIKVKEQEVEKMKDKPVICQKCFDASSSDT